jgi:hypothetical protein
VPCRLRILRRRILTDDEIGQNGKQGENKSLAEANAAQMAEAGSQPSS